MLAAISANVLLWAFLWVIIGGMIFWLANWLIGYIGIGEPVNKILRVIVAILLFVFLVNALLTLVGKPFITFG
jgi:uncharacterized membrane protein